MAALNAFGSILHGVGGGSASVDNVPFSVGAVGGWVDDETAFFADGSTAAWTLMLYNAITGQRWPAIENPADPQYGQGANTLYAAGHVWAGWLAPPATGTVRRRRGSREYKHRGLYASTGFRAPDAGLLGVGPDGAIGYKPNYHADGPSVARELTGDEWLITDGHAADLQLLGAGRACWQEGNQIHTRGLPWPQQLGPAWRPQAYEVAGRWWIAYWCDEAGVVLHPFDRLVGYVLSPPSVSCWHSGRVLDTGVLRFALSSGEGEQPGQVRAHDVDFTQPVTDLTPAPPEPIDPPPVEPPPVIEPPPIEPPIDPPPVEPVEPTPEPPKEILMPAYGTAVPGFVPGALELAPDGRGVCVKKPNGKYLSVSPDGVVEERDSPGVWETFEQTATALVAWREKAAPNDTVYVLPLVGA